MRIGATVGNWRHKGSGERPKIAKITQTSTPQDRDEPQLLRHQLTVGRPSQSHCGIECLWSHSALRKRAPRPQSPLPSRPGRAQPHAVWSASR